MPTRIPLALLLIVGCRPVPIAQVAASPVAAPASTPAPPSAAPVPKLPQVEGRPAPLEQACEGERLDLDWVAHAEACSQPGIDTTELPLRLEPAQLTVNSGDRETIELIVANDTATPQKYVVGYCDFRDGLTLTITDANGHRVDKPGPCGRGSSCGGPPVGFTLAPGGTARWPLEFTAEAQIEDDTCEVVRREPLPPGVYDITITWHSRQTLEAKLVVVEGRPIAFAGAR